jgi:mono/diheme cytochrome c family protein
MNNRLTCVGFLLPLLAACGGGGAQQNTAAAPTSAGAQKAQQLFESLCFTCHGLTGHGDGPGAGALNPKPRSFADDVWQGSVTDEQIKKTIVFGGAAVGKSPMMPAQPQLKGQTEVLDSLVAIVRGFRGKP